MIWGNVPEISDSLNKESIAYQLINFLLGLKAAASAVQESESQFIVGFVMGEGLSRQVLSLTVVEKSPITIYNKTNSILLICAHVSM